MRQIRTNSDTALTLQASKVETTEQGGKKTVGYEIVLTLSTDTGGDEDGEQTTFLTPSQADELIAELNRLKGFIAFAERNNK